MSSTRLAAIPPAFGVRTLPAQATEYTFAYIQVPEDVSGASPVFCLKRPRSVQLVSTVVHLFSWPVFWFSSRFPPDSAALRSGRFVSTLYKWRCKAGRVALATGAAE